MSIFNVARKYRKSVLKTLIFTSILSLSFFSAPQKSYAYLGVADVVIDPTNLVQNTVSAVSDVKSILKDFVLDGLAWQIGNMMIQKLTAQTVNWINSGFKGNPAFVTDPGQFFLGIGDNVASDFLTNTKFESLCSPFRAQVRLALVKNYLAETDNQNYTCTLSRVRDNYDNFVNDFSQGGWEGWFEITQTSSNNPYGAYLNAKDALAVNINAQVGKYQTQLDQGHGFLSYEKDVCGGTVQPVLRCADGTEARQGQASAGLCQFGATPTLRCPDGSQIESGRLCQFGATPTLQCPDGSTPNSFSTAPSPSCPDGSTPKASENRCMGGSGWRKETVTPGSVISGQLERAVGSSLERLNVSDSINEIVGALLTQMITRVVGGGPGLRQPTIPVPTNSQLKSLEDSLGQKVGQYAPDPNAPLPSEQGAIDAAGNSGLDPGTGGTSQIPQNGTCVIQNGVVTCTQTEDPNQTGTPST